jgi:hypothetical protein
MVILCHTVAARIIIVLSKKVSRCTGKRFTNKDKRSCARVEMATKYLLH